LTKVQLRYATLPDLLGLFAAHYWFVMWDADGCHRWEVWQPKNAGGRSIGHVHCDLRPPDAGVGGGSAAAIKAVLENVSGYPHRERYLAWPGPKSNTFVSWVRCSQKRSSRFISKISQQGSRSVLEAGRSASALQFEVFVFGGAWTSRTPTIRSLMARCRR
jgi:hypothetical protein